MNLEITIREALKVSKECIETKNPDRGFVELAIKKIERASIEIVQQGYNGISVDVLEFYTSDGQLIHIENTRDAVNDAQKTKTRNTEKRKA